MMDEALVACRFVQFTAAMLIFGIAAFRVYALPSGNTRTASNLLVQFDARFGRVSLLAAVIAMISALALLLCQAAAMTGSWTAATDLTAVGTVLFHTRFGRVWCWHLLFAAMLMAACFLRHAKRALVLILAIALLASLGWVGHAAMDEGAARIGHELNQTVHLIAAGVWLGGLPPLGWTVHRASRGPSELSLASDGLRSFSRIGYAAVALLGLTGAVNTVLLVGSLDAIFHTPYGRLLALKILLFLAMVVVASINRFRLVPELSDKPSRLPTLGRNISIEQGLGLGVLAIVSVLGTWPPAVYETAR
jgi:copper resistance protein D